MTGLSTCFQRTSFLSFTLCIAVLGIASVARADAPPATRAARLTFLQGTVTVNAPGNTESVPAQTNLPLLAGVQLVTGADGQAEVEFEDGSVARLTPNSALSLDNLAVEPSGVFTTRISLMHGLAYFELRATPQYLYSIVAGSDVLTPVENTTVRVNFDEPPASFAVLDGTAHVERQIAPGMDAANAGFQADVRAGESLRGDATSVARYFLNAGIAEDSWDQWNEDMDQTEATAASNSTPVRNDYEGAQGYGWSDLDADGTWYNVPGQGPVWQPQMAADDMGFDPYGFGEWVAYPGAGYIWASGYPWGWTPYRCGTWSFFGGFGWGWAPGGCGGFGWGFYGGGQVVNIGVGPAGYRPIRVPVTGPHPVHPVLPVRSYQYNGPSRHAEYGQRQIAGKTATAITPVSNGFNSRTGIAAGSSLRRDFPVDSKSHAPVLGLASTTPAAVHAARGQRPDQPTVARPTTVFPGNAGRPAAGTPNNGQFQPNNPNNPNNGQARPDNGQFRPGNNGQSNPQPGVRSQPASPQPTQRYTPPPSSQPAPSHPTYSPPPQQPSHPSYSPPPQPSHPSYSPPPPPPPPPASHPTYSPPPSQPSSSPHNSPK